MISWTAISRTEHAEKGWLPRNGFSFAAQQLVVEVLVAELSTLLPHYAFGFTKPRDKFQFIALLGLGGERNLYVNAEQKWLGQLVPAALRGYPFTLADNTESSDRILCIDEDHLTDDADANPLFDEEGNLAPAITEMLKFLNQCDNNRKQTQAAVDMLAEAGVIGPWPLSINRGEDLEPISIEGLYRIDEEVLNTLSRTAFAGLRKFGALALAYAQLLSQNQLSQLAQRADYLGAQQAKLDAQQGVTGLFEDEGSLNFDFLNED